MQLFRITTWGESHGGNVGVVIDGCPPRLPLGIEDIQVELDRRRPGQSSIVSPRKEEDIASITSGIESGLTLGTPLTIIVSNKDARPKDYSKMVSKYRPSHADATYDAKYKILASSGGGRASARETIGRVAAGAVAKKLLREIYGIEVVAYVKSVHNISATTMRVDLDKVQVSDVEATAVRCPDIEVANKMISLIDRVRRDGDSVGGVVECVARQVPAGLGSPVFDKLEADLAKAIMSIPATRGFEIGSGFTATEMLGSEHNDPLIIASSGSDDDAHPDDSDDDGARKEGRGIKIRTSTNNAGGVVGGISNGENIVIRAAFKPTSTIRKPQQTVTREGKPTVLEGKGRHDPCVLPRAVPIVEAMVALVLIDHLMQHVAQSGLFLAAPPLFLSPLPNTTSGGDLAGPSE
eukprot:jgi/Bigna1/34087/e_gw1.4.56.1